MESRRVWCDYGVAAPWLEKGGQSNRVAQAAELPMHWWRPEGGALVEFRL